jgi:hypothetical protein
MNGELQFDRAEYSGGTSGPSCCTCQQPATPVYHHFKGRVYCTLCRQQIEQAIEQMHQSGNLARAAMFGVGAAALGAVIFYAVSALTGYQIGLIAVVVGWLVGKAVRIGSGSRGGWRYQTLAMVLTYISIVSSYVPAIAGQVKVMPGGELRSYVLIFVLALAAPVLGGIRNIIGLVIIGIGLWEAWKFNRLVEVKFTGPFSVSTAPPLAGTP